MGWTIFFIWLTLGFIVNIAMSTEKYAEYGSKEQKIASKVVSCCMWIGIIGLLIFILYILGWVWYFCGGFLVFEDQPFWDKVICGLISLIPLGFFLGFIAICFGWDPDVRR